MSSLNERSKRQIALLAGDDLAASQADEARRNVESCPHCREHWARMRGCLNTLERVGKLSSPMSQASLWPVLESRLAPASPRGPARFNGWVPALSMAAACIALLIAGQREARPLQEVEEPISVPARSLIWSAGPPPRQDFIPGPEERLQTFAPSAGRNEASVAPLYGDFVDPRWPYRR